MKTIRGLKPILLTFVGAMAFGTMGASAHAGTWTTVSSRVIKYKRSIPNPSTSITVSGSCRLASTRNKVAFHISGLAKRFCKRYKGSIANRAHYKIVRASQVSRRCKYTIRITKRGHCQIDKLVGAGWMTAATGGRARGRKDANTIAYCKRYKMSRMRALAIRFSKGKVFTYCKGKKYWKPVTTRITSRTRKWKNFSRSKQHFVCSVQFYMSYTCSKPPLLY